MTENERPIKSEIADCKNTESKFIKKLDWFVVLGLNLHVNVSVWQCSSAA